MVLYANIKYKKCGLFNVEYIVFVVVVGGGGVVVVALTVCGVDVGWMTRWSSKMCGVWYNNLCEWG
jgi:hypothetical protein